MTIKSNVYKESSFNDIEKLSRNNHGILKGLREATTETKMRRNLAKKRKSEETGDISLDQSANVSDFARNDLIAKPTVLNSRDAFFVTNNSGSSELTDSPIKICMDKERVIKTAKSFFDDDNRIVPVSSNIHSPRRSPTSFRRELQTKPLHNTSNGGTPCGVVDELFTGFYGCMPSWECSLPWTENDTDESDDEENRRYGILRHGTERHDAKAIREHLSFPKHLGKEHVSQSEESHREQKNAAVNRTIRRSPTSRLTTLESDSRHKLPGSKMFRRTDINIVTEIHWDQEILDTKTLEKMAKLSVY